MGTLGILLSLALLMYLAYRGINVLILAPLLALLALLFAGDIGLLLPTYTQVFMKAMGGYVIQFFPLFLLGALFGKLMDDSGSARAIAHGIVAKVGSERAILAIVLACGILTYGGVSLFVVAFAVYPIGAALFREAGIPKRLIPATIGPYVLAAIGQRHARRFFQTGERFSAQKAHDIGLVHILGDDETDIDGHLEKMLAEVAKNGPYAMRAAKKLCFDLSGSYVTNDIMENTAERIATIRTGEEAQTRLKAFLEK